MRPKHKRPVQRTFPWHGPLDHLSCHYQVPEPYPVKVNLPFSVLVLADPPLPPVLHQHAFYGLQSPLKGLEGGEPYGAGIRVPYARLEAAIFTEQAQAGARPVPSFSLGSCQQIVEGGKRDGHFSLFVMQYQCG